MYMYMHKGLWICIVWIMNQPLKSSHKIPPSRARASIKELVSKLEGKASDILDQQQYAMVREAWPHVFAVPGCEGFGWS